MLSLPLLLSLLSAPGPVLVGPDAKVPPVIPQRMPAERIVKPAEDLTTTYNPDEVIR